MFQFIHAVFLCYGSLLLHNYYFGFFMSILVIDTCKQFNKVIREFYYFSHGKTAYYLFWDKNRQNTESLSCLGNYA